MDPEEEAQFSVYVTARRDQVRRTAYLMCGDWHRADDLTQIAFVKLYGAWAQIRDHGAMDAFVRRCLMRATVDESRRPWRREHAVEELPEVADESADHRRHRVRGGRPGDRPAGVGAGAAGQRAVLVLRYYEGYGRRRQRPRRWNVRRAT